MNTATALAGLQWLLGDVQLLVGRIYLGLLTLLALLLAGASLIWNLRREQCEQEFAAWFRPQEGDVLVFRDGWWDVQPCEDGAGKDSSMPACASAPRSS